MPLWKPVFQVPAAILLAACPAPDLEPTGPVVDDEEDTAVVATEGCPEGMVLVEGGSWEVGAPPDLLEADPDTSRVPQHPVTLDSFCISRYPFPGQGRAWPVDGLNGAQAADLHDLLARRCGMGLPTLSQALVALATEENHRYPGGAASWEAARCDPDPEHPERIGAFPDCQSGHGVGGLLTFAFWGSVDEATAAALEGTPAPWTGEPFALYGGMPTWWGAYYGDDLYGYHTHGPEDSPYADDRGVLVVAPPDTLTGAQVGAFEGLVEDFVSAGGAWSGLVAPSPMEP